MPSSRCELGAAHCASQLISASDRSVNEPRIARQLNLVWGIQPLYLPRIIESAWFRHGANISKFEHVCLP